MKMQIFIDDERFPPDDGKEWIIVRNYDDLFIFLNNTTETPNFVSFDHDLGLGKNGLDCARLLIDHDVLHHNKWNVEYYVHSQNPIGKKNIEGLLESWKKFKENN